MVPHFDSCPPDRGAGRGNGDRQHLILDRDRQLNLFIVRFQGPAAFGWSRFRADKSKRGDFRLPRGKDVVGEVAKMLSGWSSFFFLGLPTDDNVDERRLSVCSISCGREGRRVIFSFELCGGDEEKLVLVSELEIIIEMMFFSSASHLLLESRRETSDPVSSSSQRLWARTI